MTATSTHRRAARREDHGNDRGAQARSVSLRALTVAAYLERSYVPRAKGGHAASEEETASKA